MDKIATKSEEKELLNLRVDDLPLLYHVIQQIKIGETIDNYLAMHGNWVGASPGQIIELWLCYMLSTSDHKLSSVEAWSEHHLELLRAMSGIASLQVQDFSDDKLGLLLDYVSEPSKWSSIEVGINRRVLEVYRLEPKDSLAVLRLDAAPFQSYGKVEEGGLLQFGYSKHHPNTGQFKVKFGALDNELNNFALPLCHLTVSGNSSDDELYQPIIASSRAVLAEVSGYEKGNLYVGDNKFGSIGNRAYVEQGGDYYLMPLSVVQLSKEERIKLIEQSQQSTYHQVTKSEKGQDVLVAEGFEVIQQMSHLQGENLQGENLQGENLQGENLQGENLQGENLLEWEERRLFVRSLSYAASQEKSLNQRILKAEIALDKLNERGKGKRVLKTRKAYKEAISNILKANKVQGLLQVKIVGSKTVKEVRAYKQRPARVEVNWTFKVSHKQDLLAIEQQKMLQGWQVYATNVEQARLPFEKCVWKYRHQSRVESRFHDLRNKIVPLLPVFLQKDNRIRGLVNLLLLALKVCSVIEYNLAKALKEKEEVLKDVYEGNPRRATAKPSATRVFNAFQFISISLIFSQKKLDFALMTKLEPVQKKILQLLDIDPEIYTDLPHKIQMSLSLNEMTET